MSPTKADLAWAMKKLNAFSDRRGFPAREHPEAFEAHARAFLRIVHNKRISQIIGQPHPEIPGDENDGDWLIAEALDRYLFYPQPIQLRELYQEYLPPSDKKTVVNRED